MERKHMLSLIMDLILASAVVSPTRADTGVQYDLAQRNRKHIRRISYSLRIFGGVNSNEVVIQRIAGGGAA